MNRPDNYAAQAAQARSHFLEYDQTQILAKHHLEFDEEYIYVNLLCRLHRLNRNTGDVSCCDHGVWSDANDHATVMTLLDWLCDCQAVRSLSGIWKSMASFGLQFHQNLTERGRDPNAEAFACDPDGLRRACTVLQGVPIPGADIAYGIELFDGLRIGLQFWFGDDEFAPRLRYLWDANALQYLRYETMYYAVNLLQRRIAELMLPQLQQK